MAIVFPRELPVGPISECLFTLVDSVSASPSAGGSFVNLSQVNDPVWQVKITTGLLGDDLKYAWSAWKKSLRGGLQKFIAYDASRKTPLAYPNAKQPSDINPTWDGSAVVASLALGGALSLTGLPANYKIKAGDRVGLKQATYYGYYEILEDVTASGSGAATVTVSPFLHTTIFTTSAIATLWRPKCQFIIDWQTWSEGSTNEPTPVSFEAWQRL